MNNEIIDNILSCLAQGIPYKMHSVNIQYYPDISWRHNMFPCNNNFLMNGPTGRAKHLGRRPQVLRSIKEMPNIYI